MTNEERIEMLEEAAEKLAEVIDLTERAVMGTPSEGHAMGYCVNHLKSHLRDTNANPYNHGQIENYIDELRNEGKFMVTVEFKPSDGRPVGDMEAYGPFTADEAKAFVAMAEDFDVVEEADTDPYDHDLEPRPPSMFDVDVTRTEEAL